jgi:ParB family chromosome partitioning protein
LATANEAGRGDSLSGNGRPLQLPLDLIDEDPLQPRADNSPGFSAPNLRELGESIRRRGIKTPLSVRRHPQHPGRYIINHGARRFRAARLAGLQTVPAFVDDDYNEADQVVENLHRNDLTAREIADYIGRELARGLRRKEIAQRISKSAAYITQHAVLLDLPEPIAEAFNAGRVRDVTLVNELVSAWKIQPDTASAWLAEPGQEITRGTVRLLREFLCQETVDEVADVAAVAGILAVSKSQQSETLAGTAFHGALQFKHDDKICAPLLRRRPSAPTLVWIRYADGSEAEVALATLVVAGWAHRPSR